MTATVAVETTTEPAWVFPGADDWQGWVLTPGELAATVKKIGAINARAARRGFTGRVELDIVDEIVTREIGGLTVSEQRHRVKIAGEAPAYDGWRFLARLVWDQHSGLLVNVAPGVTAALIDRSQLEEGRCDHCRTSNANRRKIMLVEHVETGERRQVGSTCIRDFLGWQASPVFIDINGIKEGVDDGLGGFGDPVDRRWSVESVISAAWASIRARGFHRANDRYPTRDHVQRMLDPRRSDPADFVDAGEFLAESAAQARIIREWIAAQPADTEYMTNLKQAAAAEWAGPRALGLLASAPAVWARAVESELQQRQQAADSGVVNEYFGAVGDRLEVRARVEKIWYRPHAYGMTVIYKLVGESGHVFTWFASKEALGDQTGATFTVRGTIKDHSEFHGAKETIITRCKVID